MTEKIQLDLLENALDSLNESLDKYKQGENGNNRAYKFCIQNLSHFLELIFKYYVYNCHPLLIYKNPFAKNLNEDSFTINLNDAINFLRNEGRELDKDFQKDINWLKKLRNNIEHHKFNMSVDEVKNTIGRLMSSIIKFDEANDNIDISKQISKEHYFLFFELSYSYEQRVKKATDATDQFAYHPKHNPERQVFICDECEHETMIPDENTESGFSCTFCGSKDSDSIEISCCRCDTDWPKWQMVAVDLSEQYGENEFSTGSIEYWCPSCMGDPEYR